MDAVDLLGKVLQNKTLTSAIGKQVLGGLLGSNQRSAPSSGGGMLGQILSGAMSSGGQSSQSNPLMEAVLAGVMNKVAGGQVSSSRESGLGGLLGSVLGVGQPSRQLPPAQQSSGGLGGMLGSVLGAGGGASQAVPARPSMQQMTPNDCAALMIRAMVNAAKSDGRLDDHEQQAILQKFGQVGEAELEFLRREFKAPLDLASFSRSIPSGLEQQVYAISVTAIDIDKQNEASYLGQLAQGLGLDPRWCNQVHDQLGAPRIFG